MIICNIHKVSAFNQYVFGTLGRDHSNGLLAIASALGLFAEMPLFRAAWSRVLLRKIRFIDPDSVSREATAYKMAVLDVFLPDLQTSSYKREALLRCAPGDWRKYV